MAVPKRKTSKARRDKRRSHDALSPTILSTCPKCGADKMPHRVCVDCGWYGSLESGRVVVDLGEPLA
jgi:large subunit ribosomal protein L32